MAKVAAVTGSNKGIGFEVVKQLLQKNPNWIVYLLARDEGRGKDSIAELEKSGLKPRFHVLDLDNIESIKKCAEFLKKEHGGLDVLVNNAGIAYKQASDAPFAEQARVTNATNFTGTMNVCKEFFPLLRDHARVVNVSSRAGHMAWSKSSPEIQNAFKNCSTIEDVEELINQFVKLAEDNKFAEAGWPQSAYGVSKIAVTVATYIQQRQLSSDKTRKDLVVNACCPGYVKTDMSSHKGPKSVEDGADTLVYLATLPENTEVRGKFINERVENDMFTKCSTAL